MSQLHYRTRHKHRIHDGFIKLDLYEATMSNGAKRVDALREVHDHGHGAGVLPYDPDRRTALLVRQLRVPVHLVTGDGLILEAAAGLIDPDDASPQAAAVREAREELGYTVHDAQPVTAVFTIPGLVTERIFLFLATYGPADKIEGDTGADADEVLAVEEWALSDLWAAYETGKLTDVKAVICLLALRIKAPELFD